MPTALLTVIAFETWRYFPFAFLFLVARMQAIPGDLDEAARVDGASVWQRFRNVVWPQLVPVIAVLAVLRFIFTFNKFDDIYLLTGGGAGTEVVSVRVYDFLTARKDVGLAAAQAVVLAAGPGRADRLYLRARRPGRQGGRAMTAGAERRPSSAGPAAPPRPRRRRSGHRTGPHDRVPGADHRGAVLVHGGALAASDPGGAARPGPDLGDLGELTAGAYRAVLRSTDDGGQGFLVFLRNSAIVSVITTALTLLAAIPGAYAVSRLRFAGRKLISGLFLMVYLFPPMILAIPLFVLFTRLGLRGNLLGLALVYVAQTVPVAIFMLINYFETIPESLEEAGLMDGLTHFGVLRRISLPLAAPSVVATGLYVFMIAWNEFLFALLFLLERPDRWTVSLGLSRLAGSIEVPSTVLMAGSVVLTVPIVVLFFVAERRLVEGLTAGGEKG